jgi:acetyltransferase-like isoleucine patch superfamily enzyme
VVLESVPPKSLVRGNPAIVAKRFEDGEMTKPE